MKHILIKTATTLAVIFLFTLLIAGCKEKISYMPEIESIKLSPDTIAVGGVASIELVVKDQDDEDADLVYYYTTNGGSISGVGDTVEWIAPTKTGEFITRVLVTDKDGNQVVDSVKLVVIRNDTSTLVSGIAAFQSGIDGDLANAKVRLFTSLENLITNQPVQTTTAEGFGSIVSFRFDNVPIGTYYFDIWKDTDYGNTNNPGDYYGWYGTGTLNDPVYNSFTLQAGTIKAMQIQMWIMQ
jgi:hypothetical protein